MIDNITLLQVFNAFVYDKVVPKKKNNNNKYILNATLIILNAASNS